MPASTPRARQPVTALAEQLGRLASTPVFDDIVLKNPPAPDAVPLKNMHGREEKVEALKGRFGFHDSITNEGRWNALLFDDVFDTGATMDAVCAVLRQYRKINRIFVATITWK